jgi:hypothetical protein
MSKEAGQDPLGHAPDDGVVKLVGLNLTALTRHLEAYRVVGVGAEKVINGDPACRRHFGIEQQWGALIEQKYERADGDGWEHRGSGNDIVQTSAQDLAIQAYTYLLHSFPDGSCRQIRICRPSTTAWESHVPGPGIAQAISASNQEDGIGFGADDDRHCRPEKGGILNAGNRAVRESLAQASSPTAQCECDRQPPPQHPPAGG